jgi:lipid A 3-O-deacylase
VVILSILTFLFLFILTFIFQPSTALAADISSQKQKVYTFGLMQQDVESNPTEDSVSINVEVLFPTKLDNILWSPQPVIGATLNTDDDTSQIYGGLAWQYDFSHKFYTEIFLGGSIHDGEEDPDTVRAGGREAHRAYGCPLNFRESISFGWRMSTQYSLMATVSHMSNASLCDPNNGLTNAGIRVSRKF